MAACLLRKGARDPGFTGAGRSTQDDVLGVADPVATSERGNHALVQAAALPDVDSQTRMGPEARYPRILHKNQRDPKSQNYDWHSPSILLPVFRAFG